MSNILLLEDDLSLINGLSFAFKKQGFELNIARTLKEAEELWTDGKYDLLVLDVSLPDGSGFNVVNLSPKALIFQGYRALFFFKKFLIFFLKKT